MVGPDHGWGREARALAGISGAVSATMFAQITMDAVETAVAARLGAAPLAGMTLAGSFYTVTFLFALGLVTSVTPLAAIASGAGDKLALRRLGQNGILVGVAASVPLAILLMLGAWMLPAQGAERVAARAWMLGIAWGLPGWVAYVAIRCFAVAVGQVRVATALMFAALPIHAALAIGLAFGVGLGIAGVGVATALTGYAALGMLAMFLWRSPHGALGVALRPPFRFHRGACRAILRLGFPFALRIVLREAVLPVAALALAPFGVAAVAAHAVASRAVQLTGVFAYGFSDAASTRVGMALGARAPARARLAARLAVLLALLTGLVAAGIVVFGTPLARGLLGVDAGVMALTLRLLPLAALLLVLEGVQAAGSGALAGMRDARGPLLIAVVGGWLIALPLGIALARVLEPTIGLWTGLDIGWTVAASLTLLRLRRRLRDQR